MKLKIGDKVYLQRYDVSFIIMNARIWSVPWSVIGEIFRRGNGPALCDDPTGDSLLFEHVFEHPESVAWLMEQNWIVDYEAHMAMPLEELEALRAQLGAEYDAKVLEFNAHDVEYRKKYFWATSKQFEKDGHQLGSLLIMIMARREGCQFILPGPGKAHASAHPSPKAEKRKLVAQLSLIGSWLINSLCRTFGRFFDHSARSRALFFDL